MCHASLLTLAILLLPSALPAAVIDPAQLPPAANTNVDFERDIKPIFDSICFRCHGPERPKSHFRLDNRESALKGGENGIDIIPGNSASSPLIHYVTRLVPELEMPPEGKGEPLTREQIGRLRAWIDQGATWGTNPPVQTAFSMAPELRWISVEGDRAKFREVEGLKDGFGGGLEEFSIQQQLGPDTKASVEGHLLFPDNDVRVKLALDKTDVGFVHAGFEQWRRYYDDTGGYYRPFPVPSFDLNRDLHLDIGRAWIDFGLTLPRWPVLVFGYEYQFKEGAKSTLEWGAVKPQNIFPNAQNIYPASETIHEHVDVLKFDLTHEIHGWRVDDSARVEIYDLQTQRNDASSYTLGPAPDVSVFTREGATHVQGMNTLRLERQVTDWWLLSGGYFYSRFEGDASLDQSTLDAASVPAPGNFWSSDQISLKREAHAFSVASLVQPIEGLSLSLEVQNDWERQHAFGNINLDGGDPFLPASFLVQPAIVQSDLDKVTTMENAGLRFTRLPFTVLFAEARLQQQDISQFEEENPGLIGESLPETFLRDTDATNDGRDIRTGFNTSPWRWLALDAEYRNHVSDTDYDHLRRVEPVQGYSAFIRHRKIDGEEALAKLVLRPSAWLKTTLTYRVVNNDYWASTGTVSDGITPGGITPGGTIFAGKDDEHIYGLSIALTASRRLRFLGAFTYTDSRTTAAQNGDPSVVPYKGGIYSLTSSARYLIDESTDLHATYAFSHADYAQKNVADGLPLGVDYARHGLMVGVTRRLKSWLSSSLRYGFYQYSEASSGGFNNYTAHGVFASFVVNWK